MPFLLLSAPVLVGAAFGGLGPGVFATLSGALIGDYFFLSPRGTLVPPDLAHGLRMRLFLAQGLAISAIGAWLAAARRRAEKSARQGREDQESRRESEERFRATCEQAAVGIAHVAWDGAWLRVNDRLCEIVGYSREELLKLTFQGITYPDDFYRDLEQGRQL